MQCYHPSNDRSYLNLNFLILLAKSNQFRKKYLVLLELLNKLIMNRSKCQFNLLRSKTHRKRQLLPMIVFMQGKFRKVITLPYVKMSSFYSKILLTFARKTNNLALEVQ